MVSDQPSSGDDNQFSRRLNIGEQVNIEQQSNEVHINHPTFTSEPL